MINYTCAHKTAFSFIESCSQYFVICILAWATLTIVEIYLCVNIEQVKGISYIFSFGGEKALENK